MKGLTTQLRIASRMDKHRRMACVLAGASAALLILAALQAFAQPPVGLHAHHSPWPARRRVGVHVTETVSPAMTPAPLGELSARRARALGLRGGPRTDIPIANWPKEPESPRSIEPQAFVGALRELCPEHTPEPLVERVALAALSAARAFGVDPFTLVALAFHQSACDPRVQDSYGIGLTRINIGMHAAHVLGDAYRFRAPVPEGGFGLTALPLDGRPFTAKALLEPETNLYFAAAALHVFEAQCPAIDQPFGSVPHRRAISHVIFGDHVRSALPEAMILTIRRRMIDYYGQRRSLECKYCSQGLGSPLDGAPRIVIGVMGDPRDNGARSHRGIDLMANEGEPVRSVAQGTVIGAGADLGVEGMRDLSPERALRVPLGRMGARGLFVRVAHQGGLVSLYAHLSSYFVQVGERVERGQLIGRVGLTGVHTSNAHLHLGLFQQDRALDPLPWLDPFVIAMDRGFSIDPLVERLKGASRRP